jgi:hypothetical protein
MRWFGWLLIILLIFLAWAFWHTRQPVYYHLEVVNSSQEVIQQVSVFGDGVSAPSVIVNLLPGQTQALSVELLGDGELRVEVESGLNQVDYLVSKNINFLELHRQKLSINSEGRYIFSHQE